MPRAPTKSRKNLWSKRLPPKIPMISTLAFQGMTTNKNISALRPSHNHEPSDCFFIPQKSLMHTKNTNLKR